MNPDNKKELILKHVPIVFADTEDKKGFGKSITIDAGDFKETIEAWVKENNINNGKANFKEYTNKEGVATLQYNFKLSDFTAIEGKDSTELGYGAVVNLVASAYEYDNQFGKGTSASLRSIFVVEPRINSSMDKIRE